MLPGGEVDPGAQYAGAVGELAGAHAPEQVEVFRSGTIAIDARPPRFGEGAAHRAQVRDRGIVDIGEAGADQRLRPLVQLLEIVRGVMQETAPVEAEPMHIALDRVDVFLLLLGRVGVVEAQVAAAAELLRDAEIQHDRLGVAEMQGSRSAPAGSA